MKEDERIQKDMGLLKLQRVLSERKIIVETSLPPPESSPKLVNHKNQNWLAKERAKRDSLPPKRANSLNASARKYAGDPNQLPPAFQMINSTRAALAKHE